MKTHSVYSTYYYFIDFFTPLDDDVKKKVAYTLNMIKTQGENAPEYASKQPQTPPPPYNTT